MTTARRETEREVHLKEYLKVLRKHRWMILGVLVATVVTATLWVSSQTPIYQASATVLIDPILASVLNIQEVAPMGAASAWDTNYYATQYEIMKSRPVLEKVVETLKLEHAAGADPLGALQGGISIEPRRNTRLVQVKYEHPDPSLAADVANAVAHAYARYNLELRLKGARDALAWLNDRMGSLRARVQESSEAVQNYRVKAGILGLSEQRQITAQKIIDFNKAYLDAQAQRLSTEAKLRELSRIAADPAAAQTIFSVADSLLIQKLKAEAAELETLRSKLLKTYKEKHPEFLKVDAQREQVVEKLAAEIQTTLRAVQTEYKVAAAREQSLLRQVEILRREGQDVSEKEIQLVALQREHESNQSLYDAVLKRFKETGVTGGLETNNVQVVEEARIPAAPIRPRTRFLLTLAVLGGLIGAIGLAFAVEYFDTTVKSPDEVERYLGLPVVGVVPVFGTKR